VAMTASPKTRLLLLGGGLTHICLINRLAKRELEQFKIILIAPSPSFYYLEMAAGYIECNFAEKDIALNISELCGSKEVHFVEANPVKINAVEKFITLGDGRDISFDVLSLNLDPYGRYIEGVAEYAVPIYYRDNLKKVKRYFIDHSMSSSLTIVGAGKTGIEIALALRLLLDQCHKDVDITIIEAAQSLLPGYNLKTKNIIMDELKRRRIETLLGRRVIRVSGDLLVFNDNSVLDYGYLVWTAKPVSYPVLEGSGLATDENGRLMVNSTLETNKSDLIFGCGESVTVQDLNGQMPEYDADKQAGILLKNITNTIHGKSLYLYFPTENPQKVINLGNKRALIQKRELVSRGRRGWRLRRNQDQKFMKAFHRGL
jgi:NADH dehydrogenase, FAD-containing subunit